MKGKLSSLVNRCLGCKNSTSKTIYKMDYLDEKLRRRKKVEEVVESESVSYGRNMVAGAFGIHFGWVLVKLFRNRYDVVGKTRISKEFYKTWFPIYLIAGIVYPLDGFCWEKIDGQIGFWQRIVFDDQVGGGVKE